MQGDGNYYTNDKYKCPGSVRFAGKEKYANKVMVWVAISMLLFRPSVVSSVFKSEAVNSNIYINKYIASFHP